MNKRRTDVQDFQNRLDRPGRNSCDLLKVAPATECNNVSGGQVYYGTGFYGWCSAVNAYGNWWVYGRVEGTDIKGWSSASNFYNYSGGWNLC